MNRISIVFAGCALCACSAGTKPQGTSTNGGTVTISVGMVSDKSGTAADPTRFQSAELGIADFNQALSAATGFQSQQLGLVEADSTNTPAVALARAEAQYTDAGIKALMIDSSQDTLAVLETFYQPDAGFSFDIPLVAISTTSTFFNDPNATLANASNNPFALLAYQDADNWLYRLSTNQSYSVSVLLKILHAQGTNGDLNSDGMFVMGTLSDQESFGTGYVSSIVSTASSLAPWGTSTTPDGGALVMDDVTFNQATVASTSADFSPQFAQIADAGTPPDVFFEATYPSYLTAIVNAYSNGGYTQPLYLAINALTAGALLPIGAQTEGLQGAGPLLKANSTSGTTFDSEFNAKYGVAYGLYDASAYDSAALIGLAVVYAAHANNYTSFAQVQGTDIREALGQLNSTDTSADKISIGPAGLTQGINDILAGKPINYDGASGPCDFNDGNVLQQIMHFQVHDSAIQVLAVYDCISDPVNCPVVSN